MFNFTAMTDVSKYVRYGLLSMTRMPAYFHGKELGKRLPTTEGSGWTPDKKFLHSAKCGAPRCIAHQYREPTTTPFFILLWSMDKIAGQTCTASEKESIVIFLIRSGGS